MVICQTSRHVVALRSWNNAVGVQDRHGWLELNEKGDGRERIGRGRFRTFCTGDKGVVSVEVTTRVPDTSRFNNRAGLP